MKDRWIVCMILLALLLGAACVPTSERPTSDEPTSEGPITEPPTTEPPATDPDAGQEEPSPEPATSEPDAGRELTDIEWLLLGYGPETAPIEPLPDSSVTLSFGDGELGGSAGCNRYFGDATIDGATIKVGVLGSTMMWCESLMDQESAYLELLGAAQSFTWEPENGCLTIEAKGGVLLFKELEAPPDQASSAISRVFR